MDSINRDITSHSTPLEENNTFDSINGRSIANLGKNLLRTAIIISRIAVGIIATVVSLGLALQSKDIRSLLYFEQDIVQFEANKSHSNIVNWITINALLKLGLTPASSSLSDSIDNENTRLARLLIEHGVPVNTQDSSRRTPLHYAAFKENLEIVELLLNKNANVELKDRDGKTPIEFADDVDETPVWRILKDKEDELKSIRQFGNALALVAAKNGNVDEVSRLFTQGVDVNSKDEEQLTLLHHATINGDVDMVKFLLNHRAKINSKDQNGLTPLHYIAKYNHTQLATILLARGADVEAKDQEGRTPLEHAKEAGVWSLIRTRLDDIRRNSNARAHSSDNDYGHHSEIPAALATGNHWKPQVYPVHQNSFSDGSEHKH